MASAIWSINQKRLAALLILVTGPSARSLIESDADQTSTEQYQMLKDAYNTPTMTIYSILYRKIFKCHISHHKSLKEYGEEVAIARNILKEFNRPLDELAVACAFLDNLDPSYQEWTEKILGVYAKDPTTIVKGVEVMDVPTIEEILVLLIDRGNNILPHTKVRAMPGQKTQDPSLASSDRVPRLLPMMEDVSPLQSTKAPSKDWSGPQAGSSSSQDSSRHRS